MKNISLLFIFFLFISSGQIFSQNKILLLNGKTREVKSYEVKGDWLFYKRLDDAKEKTRRIDKYNVFSVTKPNGMEEIVYDPDTALEGDPGVEQVRKYIRGEQYGMAVYNAPWNKFESEVVGLTAGLLTFYGPGLVFINSMTLSRINPGKIPKTALIEPEIFSSEEFKAGYKKYARNRKTKDSLIFGGIGFTIGFTFFALVL